MKIRALFITGIICAAIVAGVVEALASTGMKEEKEGEKGEGKDEKPEGR